MNRQTPAQVSKHTRIQVLLPEEEAGRFEAYCEEKGFKKSPLIARLIRDHMNQESFRTQKELFSRK